MSTEAGRITAIIDGDVGPLTSALNQAKGQATSAASGIEGSFKKGFGSGVQSGISGMLSSMGPLGNGLAEITSGFSMAGLAAAGAVVGVAALGAASVSTAANWQSLMAGVSKTTGVEGSGLDQLSNDLQQIRMETGATAEGIASAVTTAGSIGIPTEELASFTEVAMQMGSAFGMSAEAASEAMGKIGNVVKPAEMSWTEFSTKAGSAVNDLADSMATSEAEILTGMKHLGATMALLKPPADTIPAWTAMVATVQSLGLAGDQAGEAIQDALQYATKDLKGGISGLLGMTKEELQINLRTNAPEVMQEAAAAIAALPLEQQGEALASFGQTGQKAIALLMGDLDPASGKFEKLGEAIDTANEGWEEGASLASAYGKSQETFNASIDRLYASLDVAGQKLGTVFLPLLADGIDLLTSGVQAAIDFGSGVSELFSSDLGGIFGSNKEEMYQEIVDKKRAAEAGAEIGAEVGKGVAESDDLAAAPGEALGSPDALDAAAAAGKDIAAAVFDPETWQLAANDAIITSMKAAGAGAARADWKKDLGEIIGLTTSNGIEISSTIGGDKSHSYVILKTAGGAEFKKEYYASGYTREQALHDLVMENKDALGLDEIGTMELEGLYDQADLLKIKAGLKVEVETKLDLFQIVEPQTFLEDQASALGSALVAAMKDGAIKGSEGDDLLGLARKLESWGRIYPEEYGKLAGSKYIQAMIDAIEAGDIKGALAALGQILVEAAAEKNAGALQDVAKATNIASVGYNNLEKAVADCEACLMSDFGAWQEAQDNLFNPSYIGQGGQAYLDWKNSVVSSVTAASAAVQAAGGMALGAGAQPQSVTAKLNLDTSAATAAMSAFETTAKTDIKKPLTIDSSAATSSITTIDDSAKQSVTKPLTIDTSQAMGAIASINAAASAPVYKTIYVNEVYTGSSGGSGAGAGSAGGGGGFGYSLPPIFMARGGYVSRPTLAVVGEAGPEYVIPAESMAKGLSRMGGGEVNITINSPVYGGGGQDVEALLAQRNKELVAEITAQISEARRGL